jgi:glycine/D-amino acid oxidase-like deaminating enzyme/nitrite reductase/ring-hydroxylating ferredoxin subunit
MLPQEIKSLWTGTTPDTHYPPLQAGTTVDVAIIGAGIAGLNAGYFLVQEGKRVAILEAGRIAAGTSGNTTSKLTSQHGLRYADLEERFGQEQARIYADSNQWAIEEMERIIRREGIECDFHRLPAHVFSLGPGCREKIQREARTARALGLPASFVETLPGVPFPVSGAVRFEDQAYFHPRKYLLALAERIRKKGGFIFEESAVRDIIRKELFRVVTDADSISARQVIVATDFPFYLGSETLTGLGKGRSYVLAAKLDAPAPQGMFIGVEGPRLSFRPHRLGTEEWFLIGGEGHDAGTEENIDHFARLEKTARENFPIREIGYRWAAEDTVTADKVPCIGRLPRTPDLFVTTGYNKWGMTTSFVSARLLADLLAGRPNPWTGLYDPQRLLRAPAAPPKPDTLVEEMPDKAFPGLAPGEGKVFTLDGKKAAVYKDKDGKVRIHSAVCTHLGCTIGWNSQDKTWDCPCHGSRFSPDGAVLHGPARRPLPKIEV